MVWTAYQASWRAFPRRTCGAPYCPRSGPALGDLREILLHVIAETATHAGHLDAARELINGRQWIVLTE